jgi:hypothetical protein
LGSIVPALVALPLLLPGAIVFHWTHRSGGCRAGARRSQRKEPTPTQSSRAASRSRRRRPG